MQLRTTDNSALNDSLERIWTMVPVACIKAVHQPGGLNQDSRHGATTQKNNIVIFTTTRTSNLICMDVLTTLAYTWTQDTNKQSLQTLAVIVCQVKSLVLNLSDTMDL
jgi:hypothetical protein